MSGPSNCPHCKVSLLDKEIPEEDREFYYGGATHFKREIGVEFSDLYDGVWYYECPDCQGQWGGMRAIREKLPK